jgi:DNA polymerase sigma
MDNDVESTKAELEQQDFIDSSIMELINKVNPTDKIINYDGHIVGKVRDALIEIFTEDLSLCTERRFYPYL